MTTIPSSPTPAQRAPHGHAADEPSVAGATVHGYTGLKFKTESAVSAADALYELLSDDRLRQEIGRNAKIVQERDYSLESTHRQLLLAVRSLRGD